jgi:hypothetical protein
VHFAYLPPRIAKRHISNFGYFHMVRCCKCSAPGSCQTPKHLVRGRRLARGRNIWGSSDTSQRFAVLLGSCKRPRATFKFRISGKALELEAGSPNLPPQAGWAVPSRVLLRGKLIRAGSGTRAQRYRTRAKADKPRVRVRLHLASPHLTSEFRTFDGASKCRCLRCPLRPKRRKQRAQASTSAKLECANPTPAWWNAECFQKLRRSACPARPRLEDLDPNLVTIHEVPELF